MYTSSILKLRLCNRHNDEFTVAVNNKPFSCLSVTNFTIRRPYWATTVYFRKVTCYYRPRSRDVARHLNAA